MFKEWGKLKMTNLTYHSTITQPLCIGILLVMCSFAIISSGCIGTPQEYSLAMLGDPQWRLSHNPDLIAACQYEWWTNTTQSYTIATSDSITSKNKTDVNRVCYYRDATVFVQKIGSFEDGNSAATYIWYYYEGGEGMPLIVSK